MSLACIVSCLRDFEPLAPGRSDASFTSALAGVFDAGWNLMLTGASEIRGIITQGVERTMLGCILDLGPKELDLGHMVRGAGAQGDYIRTLGGGPGSGCPCNCRYNVPPLACRARESIYCMIIDFLF